MELSARIDLARRIRAFEEDILRRYKAHEVRGTIHLSIGQEMPSVDIITQLKPGDIVTTTHRGHHHYLALTQDFDGLRDELMGLESGVNGGKCLSQHVYVKDRYYTNGVQGGMCPISTGMALAMKRKKQDNIVLCFMGDGTIGQGALYESLNMASLWQLPIVFIVENNQYAMSTHVSESIAGSLNARFHAFGLRHADPWKIRQKTPAFWVIDTYRFCGHSPSDPDIRPPEELQRWRDRDIVSLGGTNAS